MYIEMEKVTNELFEKGEELGYIVEAGVYKNEEQAEREGFYWFDEWDRWVNIERFKNLIEN